MKASPNIALCRWMVGVKQFRLGSQDLPVAVGWRANVDRADRVCPNCARCVGDELHVLYECRRLQPRRLQHICRLFTSDTSTLRLWYGQRDSVGVVYFTT